MALTEVCVILHNMVIDCTDEQNSVDTEVCSPQSVASAVDKALHTAVVSALEVEVHKSNVEYGRDNHQFFTPGEIDALHRHTITSSIKHDSLIEELCPLATLRHLHLLREYDLSSIVLLYFSNRPRATCK